MLQAGSCRPSSSPKLEIPVSLKAGNLRSAKCEYVRNVFLSIFGYTVDILCERVLLANLLLGWRCGCD